MTNEEAIFHMVLRRDALKKSVAVHELSDDIKAFDMAIKALNNSCTLDKIADEINENAKWWFYHGEDLKGEAVADIVTSIIDKYRR